MSPADLAHLHLLLNHFPIIGMIIGVALFAIALVGRSDTLVRNSLAVFFVLAVALFPLGVGPSPEILSRIGVGVIWVTALLACLLSLDRLFRDDSGDGGLDLLAGAPAPLEVIAERALFTDGAPRRRSAASLARIEADGALLLVFSQTTGATLANDAALMLARSEDGGATWAEPTPLYAVPGWFCLAMGGLARIADDDIRCILGRIRIDLSIGGRFQLAKTLTNIGHAYARLGDIALRRSDYDAARVRYEEVLPIYRRVGDVLGVANCIVRLGEIALARSDPDAGRVRYEEALPLYRRVGDVRGEANCILRLGDIALARSDPDAAGARCEEALPLYRRVGSVDRKSTRLNSSHT